MRYILNKLVCLVIGHDWTYHATYGPAGYGARLVYSAQVCAQCGLHEPISGVKPERENERRQNEYNQQIAKRR